MSTAGWLGAARIRLDRVDSTSDELWRRAEAGAAHGTVVSAAEQTAGRGRQGRSWTAAPGNLMVSWLLRLERAPAAISALSIVQGLALAQALDAHVPGRIRLKWPNDLLLDGRKLAGLLLESRPLDRVCIVSGLGLNLVTPQEGWGELTGSAAALDETGARPRPDELLDELLAGLEPAIDEFLAEGPDSAFSQWSRWSALDGCDIRWEDPQGPGRGRVLGLAADGGLRVREPDGGTRTLRAGDVHLEASR